MWLSPHTSTPSFLTQPAHTDGPTWSSTGTAGSRSTTNMLSPRVKLTVPKARQKAVPLKTGVAGAGSPPAAKKPNRCNKIPTEILDPLLYA